MSELKLGQGMRDTGGPAFPLMAQNWHRDGMNLRDYFAAKAMQASMASPELMKVVTSHEVIGGDAAERLATMSYKYADAMLKERNK